MRNPTRRNRNIGTAKQGHGKNNRLVIPFPCIVMKSFYERLGKYQTVERMINGHNFKFVIEKTRDNSYHACTIDDIEKILENVPIEDYEDLELIILRQPTRKEEILEPVWGRFVLSYEFDSDYYQAIIIESIDLEKKFKWEKNLSVSSQKELDRLKKDGHGIVLGKKYYEADYKLENIRATQLYRTLLHEIGHYVHYQRIVLNPLIHKKLEIDNLDNQIQDNDTKDTNQLFSIWDKLSDIYDSQIEKNEDQYFSINSDEREVFAHNYANKLRDKLISKKIIPFDRILDIPKIKYDKLNISDYIKD